MQCYLVWTNQGETNITSHRTHRISILTRSCSIKTDIISSLSKNSVNQLINQNPVSESMGGQMFAWVVHNTSQHSCKVFCTTLSCAHCWSVVGSYLTPAVQGSHLTPAVQQWRKIFCLCVVSDMLIWSASVWQVSSCSYHNLSCVQGQQWEHDWDRISTNKKISCWHLLLVLLTKTKDWE